jgi:arginyl-tRNA--protein-N-Asp/Glu arginylyltransferase
MKSLLAFTAPSSTCSYLPDLVSTMRYEYVAQMTAAEYEQRLLQGWRRFGISLFTTACQDCRRCLSLRIPVEQFKPDRSQKRAWKANEDIRIEIGRPQVDDEHLELYDRFHEHHADSRGWRFQGPKEESDYAETFLINPFPTEEWRYYLGEKLIGVGYVDALPKSLSAIYFYYDPDEMGRSLGTLNVLKIIESARLRGIPHLYLGYYVEGCRSLEYKGRFRPNEVLQADGTWKPFLQ